MAVYLIKKYHGKQISYEAQDIINAKLLLAQNGFTEENDNVFYLDKKGIQFSSDDTVQMDVNFIEHEILEDLINTLYPNYYQTELGGEYPIYKIKEHEENYNFELEVLKQFKKL